MLEWHPRDIDTLLETLEEQASERRMAAERQRIREAMGTGG